MSLDVAEKRWILPDRMLRWADAAGAVLAVVLFMVSTQAYWRWSWGIYAAMSAVAAATNGTAKVLRAMPGLLRAVLVLAMMRGKVSR
jgi:hypothetical protein